MRSEIIFTIQLLFFTLNSSDCWLGSGHHEGHPDSPLSNKDLFNLILLSTLCHLPTDN